MSDVEIYTGTLIGPHGSKVGRWVRFEDYSNATGGQQQTAPNAPAMQHQHSQYQSNLQQYGGQNQTLAEAQEEGVMRPTLSSRPSS